LLPITAVLACASSSPPGPDDTAPVEQAAAREVATGETGPAPVALRELPAPAHIPLEVRETIARRMEEHGTAMSQILHSTLLLDFETASTAAFAIAEQPALSRPLSEDELGAHLPDAFFALQDELSERARAFAMATVTEDPNQVAAAFANLSNTCVSCHSAYLPEPETSARAEVQ
jgi:cytochrome c556